MIRLRHKMLIQMMRVLDQIALAMTAVGVIRYRPDLVFAGEIGPSFKPYDVEDTTVFLLLVLGWIAIFSCRICYKSDRFIGLLKQMKDYLKAATLAAFFFLVMGVIFSVDGINTVNVVVFWVIVSFVGLLGRMFFRLIVVGARKSGYNYRHLLVVGSNPRAVEMAGKFIRRPELGLQLVGFVAEDTEAEACEASPPEGSRYLGKISELRQVLVRERVDEMMICLSIEAKFSTIAETVRLARELGIVVRLIPDGGDGGVLGQLRVEEFEGDHVITLFREQLLLQLLLKRAMDIGISLAALLFLSPFLLLISILVKVTSNGPVVFSQDRVGMNQRRFRLYKFRSMVQDAEAKRDELSHLNELKGPAFKMENDPRITPLGKILRKTSLDELPQLFNVLKGEMSLVGPRPPLPKEVEEYEWLFRRRLSVKPGLTCVWQVNGRNNTSFEQWMQMDQEYIENWSIWLDFKILVKTVPAVLFGRGAH